jgi:hypothetical protein
MESSAIKKGPNTFSHAEISAALSPPEISKKKYISINFKKYVYYFKVCQLSF